MTWYFIVLGIIAFLAIFVGGVLVGFTMHNQVNVGTLLVIHDPNDGDTYMTLEVKKHMAEHIYDGNEITLKVIERTGKFSQKKQAL